MKIFDKLLDNYYSKKFAEKCMEYFVSRYGLIEAMYELKYDHILIYAKPYKYRNYTQILYVKKEAALFSLLNINDTYKTIDTAITRLEKLDDWK